MAGPRAAKSSVGELATPIGRVREPAASCPRDSAALTRGPQGRETLTSRALREGPTPWAFGLFSKSNVIPDLKVRRGERPLNAAKDPLFKNPKSARILTLVFSASGAGARVASGFRSRFFRRPGVRGAGAAVPGPAEPAARLEHRRSDLAADREPPRKLPGNVGASASNSVSRPASPPACPAGRDSEAAPENRPNGVFPPVSRGVRLCGGHFVWGGLEEQSGPRLSRPV